MRQWQMNLSALAFALAVAAPAIAESRADKAVKVALALTPEHFRTTANVSDDSLDTTATISTEPGFQEKRGMLNEVSDDNFLRAFINKKSGATEFQIYQRITYDGASRYYQQVNYETPDGPKEVAVTIIAHNVIGCGRYGCTQEESFGFSVPEALLRTIASSYRPGVVTPWRFRYKAEAAEDWQDGMLPAEIVGMLQRVDQYKKEHSLP